MPVLRKKEDGVYGNIIRENGKELGIEKRILKAQEINDMRHLVATEAED